MNIPPAYQNRSAKLPTCALVESLHLTLKAWEKCLHDDGPLNVQIAYGYADRYARYLRADVDLLRKRVLREFLSGWLSGLLTTAGVAAIYYAAS